MTLNKAENFSLGRCFGFVTILLLLAGCSLADSDNNDSTMTTPDPELAATRIMVEIEPITDSLVEATPAPVSIVVEIIPDEFRGLGKNEECARPCMYGIELGQPIEDAIQAIRDNPWTDTTRIFRDGDYIDIYPTSDIDEGEGKGISWQVKVDVSNKYSELIFPGGGSIFTRNNYVYYIGMRPVNTVIPISLIIEEYGIPDYTQTAYMGPNEVLFYLIYPLSDAVLMFNAYGRGTPSVLSEHSFVAAVLIAEPGFLDSFVCHPLYDNTIQEWQGFGGLDIYYDHEGKRIGTIPFDC